MEQLVQEQIDRITGEVSTETDLIRRIKGVLDTKGAGGGDGQIDALLDGSIETLRSNCETINDYAVYGRNSLKTAVLPNVTEFETYAFEHCENLETIEAKPIKIWNYALAYCKKLENIDFSETTHIYQGGVSYNDALTTVIAPKLTSMGYYAFNSCSELAYVNLPEITGLSQYAFQNCKKLKTLIIPKCTALNSYALYGAGIERFKSDTVLTVGTSVFYNCTSLEYLDLKNTYSLGSNSLSGCSNLTTLILRRNPGGVLQTCEYVTTSASGDPTNENLKIYVPSEILEDYKVAKNWSRLADKFVPIEGSPYEEV